MNPKFKKYKPSKFGSFSDGTILAPLRPNHLAKKKFKMEEHKNNIYGDLIAGLLSLGLVILMLCSDVSTSTIWDDIAYYFILTLFIYGGLFLSIKAIRKLKRSSNKSNVIINQGGISYHDSIEPKSFKISWDEVKDVAIKYYYYKSRYISYLLVMNKNEDINELDITYLYKMNSERNVLSDIQNSLTMKVPEFLELRKFIGYYYHENKPTGNM